MDTPPVRGDDREDLTWTASNIWSRTGTVARFLRERVTSKLDVLCAMALLLLLTAVRDVA